MSEFALERKRLVESMVNSGAIKSKGVENAFLSIKREAFFPEWIIGRAYVDSAFPIGFNQTISQPSTIAIMLELLGVSHGNKVLEVGSGCGYVLALLSELAGISGSVYGVEILPDLVALASKNLSGAGIGDVTLKNADGKQAWKEEAPFDRILVSAACSEIPLGLKE